jgi:leishmanolysin
VVGTEEGLHAVTLAALEDSGWYRANYSKADRTMWGRKAGCAFVQEKCVVNGQSKYPLHFCTKEDVTGCTLQRNYKAMYANCLE